jgi:hypothetical protein
MIPELNPLLIGAAAGLAAFWSQAKGAATYVSGFLLLQKKVNDDGGLAETVFRYIRHNCKRVPSGLGVFRGRHLSLEDSKEITAVAFELPAPQSVWYGRHGPFLVSISGSDLTLIGPRFFFDPYALVKAALEWAEAQRVVQRSSDGRTVGSGFYIQEIIGKAGEFARRGGGSGRDPDVPVSINGSAEASTRGALDWPDPRTDVSFSHDRKRYERGISDTPPNPFRGLAYGPEVLSLLSKIDSWFESSEWYQDHNIPWKRGVLLYGPGGTGKSSLTRAVAERLQIVLVLFRLSTLTDREFIERWTSLPKPCLVVFEDFDTSFHGRTPVTPHKSLSFDTVLNCVSGIGESNGILLFITTNNLELIDPAIGGIYGSVQAGTGPAQMSTRPGRVDYILYLGPASLEQKRVIATQVFGDWAPSEAASLVSRSEKEEHTPAQFQMLCVERALEILHASDRPLTK